MATYKPNKSKEIKVRIRICSHCGDDFENAKRESNSICPKCRSTRARNRAERERNRRNLPYYLRTDG